MSGAHRSAEAHGEAKMNENGAFVARFCKIGRRFAKSPNIYEEIGEEKRGVWLVQASRFWFYYSMVDCDV